MKQILLPLSLVFLPCIVWAQIVSGPMLGQVEIRDARIWVEVKPSVKKLQIRYYKKDNPASIRTVDYTGQLGKEFNPVQFHIGGLDMNTTYQYKIVADGKEVPGIASFTTKDLWQYRKPAPDFSFITG